MKKTYTASIEGQTFTRKSERLYAYAVTYKRSEAADIAYVTDPGFAKQDRRDHSYYVSLVARNDFAYTNEERARSYAAMTADEYVADRRAGRLARVAEAKASGSYDRFIDPSWTSRRDLAEKEAATLRNKGLLKVTILEAVAK